MSDLSSIFDVLQGHPDGSALTYDFAQDAGATADIEEGTIVAVVPGSSPASVDRHTSAWIGPNNENFDHPWIVIRGKESWEAQEAKKLTCLKMRTGLKVKVPYTSPPVIGNYLWADDGVLTVTDPGNNIPHLAKVIDRDTTENWVIIES
jgi:hypothetical protein